MFPSNPTIGEQVTLADGRVFEWDGVRWNLVESGGGGPLTDPTTTLGDLIVRGTSALARLGVGANDQVLTTDSAATLGVTWKTGAAGEAFVGNNPPPSANEGRLWFDGQTFKLFIRYSNTWIGLN